MTVHLFGVTSSPSCTNFALKQTANDFKVEYGEQAANFMPNDFYVDHGLKSVATAASAVELVRNVRSCATKEDSIFLGSYQTAKR